MGQYTEKEDNLVFYQPVTWWLGVYFFFLVFDFYLLYLLSIDLCVSVCVLNFGLSLLSIFSSLRAF